tara:strand:+ start:2413 stop:2559 length:147 start_codon:yes stop_codon:yes gene_type:complete
MREKFYIREVRPSTLMDINKYRNCINNLLIGSGIPLENYEDKGEEIIY